MEAKNSVQSLGLSEPVSDVVVNEVLVLLSSNGMRARFVDGVAAVSCGLGHFPALLAGQAAKALDAHGSGLCPCFAGAHRMLLFRSVRQRHVIERKAIAECDQAIRQPQFDFLTGIDDLIQGPSRGPGLLGQRFALIDGKTEVVGFEAHDPNNTSRYLEKQYPEVNLPVGTDFRQCLPMENNERLQALLLKILEKFCDGNKAELARQIKKDASYINRLFYPASKAGAKGIGTEIMDACKKAFPLPAGFWDMQPDEALTDRAAPTLIDLEDHPDLVPVRSVKMRLQAGVTGFSIEADQGGGPPIFFRADWLAEKGYKPYNLVAVKVRGPSMESTLFEGDMVVVNSADTEPKDGKVFAVNYEGEAVIKRLVRDGGTWWLSSDNPDQRRFPRKECAEGSCIIVGAVIHRQSEQI